MAKRLSSRRVAEIVDEHFPTDEYGYELLSGRGGGIRVSLPSASRDVQVEDTLRKLKSTYARIIHERDPEGTTFEECSQRVRRDYETTYSIAGIDFTLRPKRL